MKGLLRKGQGQRIRIGPAKGIRGFASGAHHFKGKVGGRDLAVGCWARPSRASSCAKVQQAGLWMKPGAPDDFLAPAHILPGGHQAVHYIIAAGNAGKNILHITGFFSTRQMGHRVSRMRLL